VAVRLEEIRTAGFRTLIASILAGAEHALRRADRIVLMEDDASSAPVYDPHIVEAFRVNPENRPARRSVPRPARQALHRIRGTRDVFR